jgi:hypothetical protein
MEAQQTFKLHPSMVTGFGNAYDMTGKPENLNEVIPRLCRLLRSQGHDPRPSTGKLRKARMSFISLSTIEAEGDIGTALEGLGELLRTADCFETRLPPHALEGNRRRRSRHRKGRPLFDDRPPHDYWVDAEGIMHPDP